tara:strand:- start:168 stop:287 length:120 start_codon:yes stop_codon:yes gene_type:complete
MYDPVVYPMESSWFGEIDETGEEIPMELTQIYRRNSFGL